MSTTNPTQKSIDLQAMWPFWRSVRDVTAGLDALKSKGTTYLPKFPDEPDTRHVARVAEAKLTNVFRDVVEDLSSRPFAKKLDLISEGAPDEMVALSEDVDGQGSHLHVFAAEMMFYGVSRGVDFLFVDHTEASGGALSRAEEIEAGDRVVWRRIAAEDMIDIRTAVVGGVEEFVHVRWHEEIVEFDGFKEERLPAVRVVERPWDEGTETYGPPVSVLWRKDDGWLPSDAVPLTIGFIPLVAFLTGRRPGESWQIEPPMRDVLDLQLDLFRQETGLSYISRMAAYPMLVGEGVQIPDEGFSVGPGQVLVTDMPTQGEPGKFSYLEPGAQSLDFLRQRISDTISQMREIGRQPLNAQSGNLTAAMAALIGSKANSAVAAWALQLADALELAFLYSAEWRGIQPDWEPIVSIHTDFAVSAGGDDFSFVIEMYQEGLISREKLLHEAKRRGIVDPDHDAESDLETILQEADVGLDETRSASGLEAPDELSV